MVNILAGPALRYTNKKETNIWLVLDQAPNSIELFIYDTNKNKVGTAVLETLVPVKLGAKLYFYLIKAQPIANGFSENTKYYYDVIINNQGLSYYINQEKPISYNDDTLPSFFIPDFHQNIIQASCRKPHAAIENENVVDKTIDLDHKLGKLVNDLTKRPSILCLTGDQIYVDDVAVPLLSIVSELSSILIGFEEVLPAISKNNPPVKPSNIKLTQRDGYLNKEIGFTSGSNQQHLMSFGEIISMYLVAWGGLEKYIEFKSYDEIKNNFPNQSFFENRRNRRKYEKEWRIVKNFIENSWHLRRLMANIPCYMIFDDHDVTDDWNLNQNISDNLKTNPLSRRVISNALGAFWACQAWGNSPNIFGDHIKDAMIAWYGKQTSRSDEKLEEILLQQYWGYLISGSPALIFLDTRTKRHYDNSKLSLMNREAMQWLQDTINQLSENYKYNSIIIVSPTPVFGFKLIETIQLNIPKALRTAIDREPWIANPKALAELKSIISSIEGLEHIVIFSGDVHYGFHRLEKEYSEKNISYWQLTSSASCNIAQGKIGRGLFSRLDSITNTLKRYCINMSIWLISTIIITPLHKLGMDKNAYEAWAENSRIKNPFHRNNTRYLIPEEEISSRNPDFVTADTNIAILNINQHGPIQSNLYCSNQQGDPEYVWTYNLIEPKEYLD